MQIVTLSVRGLIEFVLRCGSIDSRFSGTDRALEGGRIHRKLQKAGGDAYKPEVSMKATRIVDDIEYHLDGRADGVITESGGIVIDEIKTTDVPADRLTADFNALHWAQAQCYAAFYCADYTLDAITVQLTYYQIDTDEVIRHRRDFQATALEQFLCDTLHLYTRWAKMTAEWRTMRNASLQALTFPFSAYRAGQYRLAGAVYKTIVSGGRLFAGAPTGIGKTISTLFPAIKAMGEGYGAHIFYLTAKTSTRQAAEDAVALLRQNSATPLHFKTVTLTAKDKICPLETRNCTPDACPYANGYYDRVNDALYDFLKTHDNFARADILRYAAEKSLCPFELGLDISLFCDCIIGDYNYLFDPVVSLQRFFSSTGKSAVAPADSYLFLIDEAHNLVDRARGMYSAKITKSSFYTLKKALGKSPRKLVTALGKISNAFIDLRHTCEEAGVRQMLLPDGVPDIALLILKFTSLAQEWLADNKMHVLQPDVLQLYFEARFFLRIAELFDEHFTALISVYGSEVQVELLCVDASQFLDKSMMLGRASILFSATLSPVDYFIATLGGGANAKRTQLTSPFPSAHFCLLCADTISTKYNDRADTLEPICAMIAAAVMAKCGNYIVFLPSYAYLKQMVECFAALYPDIAVTVQTSGMDDAARETFLAQFHANNADTLVGFCVLGGAFAEGIDLAGDRLIGSIIVGVGLPQIGPEQNALRDYYAKTCGMGFQYAYQYPGMNKVLQAAGRVIRTENDKGMVLLIDSRYANSEYKALFPPHWAHYQRVERAQDVTENLRIFWET
ncbi:MAG: ATP-dependent DNA helicase [Ruthenibacterium sp.]